MKVFTVPQVSEENADKRDIKGFHFAEGNLQLIWAFATVPLHTFPPYFLAFYSQGFLSFKDPLASGAAQILTLQLKWTGCKAATQGLAPDKTWASGR